MHRDRASRHTRFASGRYPASYMLYTSSAWHPGAAAHRSDDMKFFVDTADTAEIKSLAASGLLDGVTTNPSLIAKTGSKFLEVHRRDLRHRARPGQRRGRRHRVRRHDGRGPRAARDRQEHHGEGAADAGRAARLPPSDRRRRDGERDAVLLGRAGDAGGQGRRHLRQPVRRPAGRYRRGRHGADRRHRARSSAITRRSRPRCWWRRAQSDARGGGGQARRPCRDGAAGGAAARCSTIR